MYTFSIDAPVVPLLKSAGCYVDKEDETAYMFRVDGKMTCVTGVQAFTQAMVSIFPI